MLVLLFGLFLPHHILYCLLLIYVTPLLILHLRHTKKKMYVKI